jgi:hypothetical protein
MKRVISVLGDLTERERDLVERAFRLGRQSALREVDAAKAEMRDELTNIRSMFQDEMESMQRELAAARVVMSMSRDDRVLH